MENNGFSADFCWGFKPQSVDANTMCMLHTDVEGKHTLAQNKLMACMCNDM